MADQPPRILTIRAPQMDALGLGRKRSWEDQVVAYIANDYPFRYEEMGEAGARKLIQPAVKAGAVVGIESESSVAGLVELMVAFGEDFERSPDGAWAKRMMKNEMAPGELRVHLMRDRMMTRTQGRAIVAFKPEAPKG